MRRLLCLILLVGLVSACAPAATPEVIRYTSSAPTAVTPSATPTGPTPTATNTSTPYTRPTDDQALRLDQPIVRIGDETITLGQYRQRVRFERFSALDNALRLIQRVGIDKFNFNQMGLEGNNPTAEQVAAVFNTLSNSSAFGYQVYDIMVRESIIRQEFNRRGMKLDPADVQGYWIRRLDLQKVPDINAALPKAEDDFIAQAMNYSGFSRDDILKLAEVQVMSADLRPVIGKENVTAPTVIEFKLHQLVTKSQTDAEAALAALKQGTDFRSVACQYSTDSATRGQGGDLGFKSRGKFLPDVSNPDAVFKANVGDLVGPVQSSLGWYVFRIKDQRKNADGDTELDVQSVLVASQSLANDVKSKAQQGQDFSMLACQYSLDSATAGNGGDIGWTDPNTLPSDVAQTLKQTNPTGLIGPFSTPQGFMLLSVDDHRVNVPKPEDVDNAESQAYVDWQSKQASSKLVVALSEAWKDAIPTDPLPRDVSPIMREENFGLPTPLPTAVATPTPGATQPAI